MTNTGVNADIAPRGQPEVFGLQGKPARSRKLQKPPLLPGRDALGAPHADGALANPKRLRNGALGTKDFLNPVECTHARTSHAVKSAVKRPREETAGSIHVKIGRPLIGLVPASVMVRGRVSALANSQPAEIARRLEATRRALDLSAVQICRATGIKENTWSNYKNPNRKSRPSLDEMISLCNRYPAITLDWIYLGRADKLAHDLGVAVEREMAAIELEEEQASKRA